MAVAQLSAARIVVVGAGQAGAWVARSARLTGSAADIVLIGAEAHHPYERPPLSKKVLLDGAATGIDICPPEEWRRLGIEYRPGAAVVSLDRGSREISTDDGRRISYDKLVLTTGGRPILARTPGFDLPAVHTLRCLDDALRISACLRPGARILVVGGGWIGLEVAAAARQRQAHVTVVESRSRLCSRSVPPLVADCLRYLHASHGVRILLNTSIQRLSAAERGVVAELSGSNPPETADAVIVGIGLEPNVELAIQAGLKVDNGVVVDEYGCTSDPDIYAAGDVTNQPSPWAGGRVRLESWANAQNQGIAVGKTLAGASQPYADIPWFWSDQYDVQLQVLGFPDPNAQLVVRGETGQNFCAFQLVDQRLRAVIAWNRARDLKLAKRLMTDRTPVSAHALANEAIGLESLAS
ncbi:MAG TPA: FAD-dependent oxidoreductase [Steroidobacteraceae bacterium]|nr:FAD-dependent oxidoreductase [Steroidobacteraceae bacterium]